MLLHEIFACANMFNEPPAHSVLVTGRRKLVAFMPSSRLPNLTLELVGSQVGRFIHKLRVSGTPIHNISQLRAIKHFKETECSIEMQAVLASMISQGTSCGFIGKKWKQCFVDAFMTFCCPAEKEFLLSWKGIIVHIFCVKVRGLQCKVVSIIGATEAQTVEIDAAVVLAESKFWISLSAL